MEDAEWDKIKTFIHNSIKEALAEERHILEQALNKHARGDDHLYLKELQEREFKQAQREEQKQKRWDQIRTTVIGGAILGLLFWIGSGALALFQWVMKHVPIGH